LAAHIFIFKFRRGPLLAFEHEALEEARKALTGMSAGG